MALGEPGDTSSPQGCLRETTGQAELSRDETPKTSPAEGRGWTWKTQNFRCRWEAASNQSLCLSSQSALALQRRSGQRGWASRSVSRAAVTCRVQLQVVTPGEGGVSLCLSPFLLRSCNALPEPRNPSILPE